MTAREGDLTVLFIGGTGCISRWSVRTAIEAGHRVILLNRGRSTDDFGDQVVRVQGDKNNPRDLAEAVKAAGGHINVVADFLSFIPDDLRPKSEALVGKLDQYIFISSATVYEKPPSSPFITEKTPVGNPFSEYARSKIACEEYLRSQDILPWTIVRPSYTYDEYRTPSPLGGSDWTNIKRMREGKPVIVPGDGTGLWSMTHSSDFARGFVGLFGAPLAAKEAFHIIGEEILTWNEIVQLNAEAAGVTPQVVHIASDRIVEIEPSVKAGLHGDKIYSVIFDNSKLRTVVPDFTQRLLYGDGIRQSLTFLDAHPEHQHVNDEMDARIDRILAACNVT